MGREDAAARERLTEATGRLGDTVSVDKVDLAEVLAALLAAEAERDQARSSLEEHRIAYTALTGERDAVQAHYTSLRRKYDALEQCHWDVEQRATRLAALETAARAWAEAWQPLGVHSTAYEEAQDALRQIVAAPPGEEA